jgi:hypothetical protein
MKPDLINGIHEHWDGWKMGSTREALRAREVVEVEMGSESG